MTLRDMAIKNLLRRRSKAAFILAGLVIGVATVVAVLGFADAMSRDINHKLEKFGANILVVPARHSASISTKLMQEMAGATMIGPILSGIDSSIQICASTSRRPCKR